MSTLSHPIPLPQTSTHLPMIPTPLDWFYPTQTRHLRHMKSLPQLTSQALTSFHPPQYPAMGETSMESYVQCAFFHTYAHTEDNIKVTELSIPHTLVLLTLHKAPPKRRHLQTRTQHRPHQHPRQDTEDEMSCVGLSQHIVTTRSLRARTPQSIPTLMAFSPQGSYSARSAPALTFLG